ncbi:MAG: LLM class flavin-dependent oxidoreductase [Mycetocola reblochoni]|uniref:Nitrilotriacetate monooxygenase component A n=2 Tax=Mycetocola reblochoni TaxID=331618 RepID=A0A1R4IVI0_9MICO|nr:LLM class flavin-dependent oxidoreductase [Mycetocola reblochoni]RLP71009.1 LLM class flavin-dependent oxidoreductase [Mycetocola reblochoni]SJN23689.1 Nitrilotriacetate monooxygenase component A [Mycetocola reblochoni REB411]
MGSERRGHVILGLNVLVLGYVPSAWQTELLDPLDPVRADYWRRIGALAERATLDAVFLADSPSLSDPSYDAGATRLDPTIIWSTVARATSRVGLIATASTTFNDPVEFARRLLTLDHVSAGRAGWNVVTSRHPGVAENFGLPAHIARDDRYARADEFVDVVTGLWDSTRTGDRLRHEGEHFRVDDALALPSSAQGRPVIVQAGGSDQGRRLAGRVADAVFSAELTPQSARAHYREVRDHAVAAGRAADSVSILPGLLLTLGSTEEEARRRSDELHEQGPPAYATAWLSQAIGYDVAGLALDEPFPDDVLAEPADPAAFTGSIGFRQSIVERIRQDRPTVREYLRETRYTGSGHGGFTGTPEGLVDRIESWYRTGAADGFNLQPDRLIDGLEVIADEVIPLLRRRGLFREDYETETLRGHLNAAQGSAS